MTAQKQLLSIVKSILTDVPYEGGAIDWRGIIEQAKQHGLLRFVLLFADGLPEEEKPDAALRETLARTLQSECMVCALQLGELECIQSEMEASGVYTLAVKGAVTAARYPDVFLRSMNDLDILYRAEQQSAFRAAMERLGYTDYKQGRKHDFYCKKPRLMIEAHRELVNADSPYAQYCEGVWTRSVGDGFTKHMSMEDEFVFHVIHLAQHFAEGGAGIRFFVDVFVYDSLKMDRAYVESELEQIGLLTFYRNVCALAQYWFGNGASSKEVESMGAFVLSGSIYGTADRAAALAVSEGKFRFLMHTCFPGFAEMRSMFPWLESKRALLPYAWMLRGARTILYRRNHLQQQLNRFKTGDSQSGAELTAYYQAWGLQPAADKPNG